MTEHRPSRAGGLELESIAARLKAATPGPWVVGVSESREGGAPWPVFRLRDLRPEDLENTQPNVEFVAHAPEDIAALLEEVRALRTALRPGDDAVETIRQDETVRDAFVDCYTVRSIMDDETERPVSQHWLAEWDRVESALIRAILVRVGAPERDLGNTGGGAQQP